MGMYRNKVNNNSMDQYWSPVNGLKISDVIAIEKERSDVVCQKFGN